MQEVEGFRTDVRVVVLSYFNTDWYIDQSTRPAYESQAFPYTLSLKDYQQGGPNDYLPFKDLKIGSIDAKQYVGLLSKNYPQLRSDDRNIIPSKMMTLDIDKADVLAKGIIPKGMDSLLVDRMQWKLLRGGLEKKDLAIIDLIVTNNWERPLYFNNTSLSQINIDLTPYMIQEGMAMRLLPIKNPDPRKNFVSTSVMFDNMVNKYQYRGLDNPKVYYNEDYRGFVLNHRSSLNDLADMLIMEHEAETNNVAEAISVEGSIENKMEKARKVVLFSLEKMPDKAVPYDQTISGTVELLFKIGEKEKAIEIAKVAGDRADEMATYIIANGQGVTLELRKNLFVLGDLQRTLHENGEHDLAKKFEDAYEKHLANLQIEE